MPKFDSEDYLPVEIYVEALDAFHIVSGIILFEYARRELNTRNVIIRDLIARTDTMMRAVFRIWDIQDYQDCWILYRCLMDRLFHLSNLDDHDQFEIFEEWSFFEKYKGFDRVLNARGIAGSLDNKMISISEEILDRVKFLSKNPPAWRRPKAKDVAKRLNMHFLYSLGYDYGSTHVHPMADDGNRDFFTITKLKPTTDLPDERSVLSNTLLIGTMIVQNGLNASTLDWHSFFYDFLDNLRGFLDKGSNDYKHSAIKLAKLFEQQLPLCRMRDDSSNKNDTL